MDLIEIDTVFSMWCGVVICVRQLIAGNFAKKENRWEKFPGGSAQRYWITWLGGSDIFNSKATPRDQYEAMTGESEPQALIRLSISRNMENLQNGHEIQQSFYQI